MSNVELILTEREIVCPSGRGGPLIVDLVVIAQAEKRLFEVATVTPIKAPELLATYNKTYLDLNNLIVRFRAELGKAESAANSTRARILLDQAPQILKDKGLTSSVDLREAVLDSKEEYVDAKDRCHQIACVIELLRGKQKAFENAYTSVKKIMGEDAYGATRPNPNLSGGIPEDVPVGTSVMNTKCSVCSMSQFRTAGGGITCLNGHGGAIPEEKDAAPLSGINRYFGE